MKCRRFLFAARSGARAAARRAPLFGLAALLGAASATAQANANPNIDVELGILGGLTWLGRSGTFPDGVNGMAMSTTSCNVGSQAVPWFAPMQENHPFIAFLLARETNGRFVQISDRSHVKHGFFALSDSQCTPCQVQTNGDFLGVGCSDTYNTSSNGDNFWLGPADEIDPWLGTWDAQCSYFDKGDPPAPPAEQCDGIRSLTGSQAFALGPVGHRINVTDQDLLAGGTFWYQGQYVIRAEPVERRLNNVVSRQFFPSWNGSSWVTDEPGGQLDGSILQRWSTADSVEHAANGQADGQAWVAVAATQGSGSNWHYEVAVHNVDNSRGFDGLRIPLGPGTAVSGFGFRDIDLDAGNDWTALVQGSELVFSTSSNPLRWNTIYNFWFEADTGPGAGSVALTSFGGLLPALHVSAVAPLGDSQPIFYCGPKLSSIGCVATLTTSSPLQNPVSAANDYAVEALGVQGQKTGLLFFGASGPAMAPFGGGTLCVKAPLGRGPLQSSGGTDNGCDGGLSMVVNTGIGPPSGPDVGPGNLLWVQGWYRDPDNGPGANGIALTNAVELEFF